jgi:hypothetical protein
MPGATLSFDLDARWLDLVTVTGPSGGTAAITIDGSPLAANRVSLINRQALIDLSGANEVWSARVPVVDGLTPGVHHVVLRVLSGQVIVDGIVADSDSPRNALIEQFAGSMVGLAVLVVAIARRPASVICPHRKPCESV